MDSIQSTVEIDMNIIPTGKNEVIIDTHTNVRVIVEQTETGARIFIDPCLFASVRECHTIDVVDGLVVGPTRQE